MEKKSVCKLFCTCFIIEKKTLEREKIFKIINNLLEEYKKDKKLILSTKKTKSEVVNYFWPYGRKNLICYVSKSEKEVAISIRIELKGMEKISEENIKDLNNKYLKEIFNVLEDNKIETKGNICSSFIYDTSKYTFGILKLPIEMSLTEESVNHLGKASVTGIELKFVDSKIGLEKIFSSQTDGSLLIYVVNAFKTKNYINIVLNNYKQVKKISDLFVELK